MCGCPATYGFDSVGMWVGLGVGTWTGECVGLAVLFVGFGVGMYLVGAEVLGNV